MSSLLLPDAAAAGARVRRPRAGRRVVPLAEYRAARAGHPAGGPSGHAGALETYDACDTPARPARGTAAAAPAGEPPLRLTRRGRAVARVLGAAALLLVVAGGVLVDRPALAGGGREAGPVAQHVVLPGETLWEIAGEVAPGVDRRETVAQIVELNDLPSAEVRAGQRLAVPARTP
jgi:hypothetical protein